MNELGQRLRAKLVPIDTTVVERHAHVYWKPGRRGLE
jgi:hypothetical protein